jgi:hypothetical protein
MSSGTCLPRRVEREMLDWMGATHFLTKTLARVRTEMSLHVLAYNLKRVMRILGDCSARNPRQHSAVA